MPRGSNAKRERQYEHIRDQAKASGESDKRAKEIAARTVNKERARAGEARELIEDVDAGHLVGPPRRAALRAAGAARADARPALRRGEAPQRRGPVAHEQGAAAKGRGREEVVRPRAGQAPSTVIPAAMSRRQRAMSRRAGLPLGALSSSRPPAADSRFATSTSRRAPLLSM